MTGVSIAAGQGAPANPADAVRSWVSFLAPLLWPDAEVTWLATPKSDALEYGILRVPHHPFLMVPADSPAAARAAVRGFSRGRSTYIKVARAGLASAVSIAPAGLFPRRRLGVHGGVTLEGHLRAVMGCRDLVAAITLAGRPTPHQKPVLHLLNGRGQTLGYAKVGWNDSTRRMVQRETTFLLEQHRFKFLAVPRVLHRSEWHGSDVLVVSPLNSRERVNGAAALFHPALAEVARVHGTTRQRMVEAPFWLEIRNRFTCSPAAGVWLPAVEAATQRFRSVEVEVGAWHGDWRQKNIAVADGVLQVWDWDRWADGVPVGFDVLHLLFQTAVWAHGRDVAGAVDYCHRAARQHLVALGVADEARRPLLTAYLFEVAAGLVANNDGGDQRPRVNALCRGLTRWMAAEVRP